MKNHIEWFALFVCACMYVLLLRQPIQLDRQIHWTIAPFFCSKSFQVLGVIQWYITKLTSSSNLIIRPKWLGAASSSSIQNCWLPFFITAMSITSKIMLNSIKTFVVGPHSKTPSINSRSIVLSTCHWIYFLHHTRLRQQQHFNIFSSTIVFVRSTNENDFFFAIFAPPELK